jgi:2-C-methyl-D-erythritol 4-phosphate cytidylyltransferase/2-C-methyl-D-erythritol 2,4-cyclodiphosphate synthase
MSTSSFLIAAGGTGNRLGGIPKQFRYLQNIPLLMWSVRIAQRLFVAGMVNECVVVLPSEMDPGDLTWDRELFTMPLTFVKGGKSRRDSVLNGLWKCSGDNVLIHDAARPFLDITLCEELISATRPGEGAVPFLRISDALKELVPEQEGCIRSIDRERYIVTQTPQSFPLKDIITILEEAPENIKDEAEAWTANGLRLNLVQGDPRNFKITYEKDWNMAKLLSADFSETRTGYGFDIHSMVPGRKLILAGIEIPGYPLGLKGHSDADLVAHAISDAILGAAGLPDIGLLFPADDPEYKDADSLELLRQVVQLTLAKGWQVQWIDTVIHAQRPVLAEYRDAMIANIGPIVKGHSSKPFPVNIKFKSGEHIGPVGNLECLKCYAVATIRRYGADIAD